MMMVAKMRVAGSMTDYNKFTAFSLIKNRRSKLLGYALLGHANPVAHKQQDHICIKSNKCNTVISREHRATCALESTSNIFL